MAIVETVSLIKLVADGLKGILDIAKTIKNADLLEKTSALLTDFIGVQARVLELQNENDALSGRMQISKKRRNLKTV